MTREPTHRIYVHNRKRRRENTLCCTHSKREVGGGGLGKEEKSIRTTHSTHRERERETESWTALLAASCLIHYLKADHGKDTWTWAKNTNIQARERERESGIASIYLPLGWWLIRRVPAERDFPDKSDERNESAAAAAAVWNRVQNEGIGWCNTSGDFPFFFFTATWSLL